MRPRVLASGRGKPTIRRPFGTQWRLRKPNIVRAGQVVKDSAPTPSPGPQVKGKPPMRRRFGTRGRLRRHVYNPPARGRKGCGVGGRALDEREQKMKKAGVAAAMDLPRSRSEVKVALRAKLEKLFLAKFPDVLESIDPDSFGEDFLIAGRNETGLVKV